MKRIRTRYAPSPTGHLHIGGARTALFSFLFAKHYQGEFIIRLEDTDQKRNIADGEASQIDNLAWLGIEADESPRKPVKKYGPYRQSEKLERYREIVEQLLLEKKAYKAYDNPEELTAQREEQKARGQFSFRYNRDWLKISEQEKSKRDKNKEYTVRLFLKHNYDYQWNDLVRGTITVNTEDIGDWVIQKQDGFPTYNLANVIDDHDMEITHVLRGEEHITNTPKQLAVYEAMNWKAPKFGHLTVITNMEGKKLSKRDVKLKQFIRDYRNEGYMPEAIFNFLALLGWTHPKSKELLTAQELITSFDSSRFSKSPSKFDQQKMHWFSKEYLKTQSNSWLKKQLNFKQDEKWMNVFLDAHKSGCATITELQTALDSYNNKTVKKMGKTPLLRAFYNELAHLDFTVANIQKALDKTQKLTNLKGKNFFMPIRQVTTYQDHGPELAKAIFLVGQDLINKRLKSCL